MTINKGSVNYQDDFLIPGISPRDAISLKQMRHSSKSLIYPLFRPQRKHRRTARVENFGFLFARAITDFFAITIF